MASKGLGPLPRGRGSALAHGCGRGGRVVLPLPRAAAISTGLRVRGAFHGERAQVLAEGLPVEELLEVRLGHYEGT